MTGVSCLCCLNSSERRNTESVGGRDGIREGHAGAGAVDGATRGVRQADRQGGEQLRGVPCGRGEPAHGDTLALRAHGHLHHGPGAALSADGYHPVSYTHLTLPTIYSV